MARLLIDAIYSGDEPLARSIIETGTYGCIDSQTSRRDGTALFFACSRGYLQLVKLLLARGASASSRNKCHATPLHAAVDNGHDDITRLLLQQGVDVNAQTYRGDSPLHLAAYRGFSVVVRTLLENGADTRLVNNLSITAQNEALGQGHMELASYLRAVNECQFPEAASKRRLSDSVILLDPPAEFISLAAPDERETHQAQQPQQYLHPPPHHHVEQHQYHHHHHNNNHQQQQQQQRQRQRSHHSDTLHALSGNHCSTETAPTGRPPLGRTGEDARFHEASQQYLTVSPPCDLDPSYKSSGRGHSPHTDLSHRKSPVVLSNACAHVNNLNSDYATRRPSTASSSSCFSELGSGVGSDVSSVMSCASDASSCYGDVRPEELELQDKSLLSHCGVNEKTSRNLPTVDVGSAFRRASVTSPDPSEHFTAPSFGSGCFMSLSSGSLMSVDSIPSDVSTMSSHQSASGRRMSASSAYSSLSSGRRTSVSVASTAEKPSNICRSYSSTESRDLKNNLSLPSRDFFPGYESFQSNDLSSTASNSLGSSEKGPASMTFLNIPIN